MAAENNADTLWGWQSKIKTSAERGKHILGTSFLSDVTFRVGRAQLVPKGGRTVDIKAHKFLLAAGSAVFEAMFYGNLPETKSIIPITDIDPEPFRILLRFLYHDQIGPFDVATAFPTLYAAKKYGLPILKDACEGYLRACFTAQNCLAWFVQAKMYDEPELAEFFLAKIDTIGVLVLKSADFLDVDIGTLKDILSRDSLKVREVDVYEAAVRWAKNRCAQKQIDDTGANLRSALGDALFLIRFPIMTSQEVASGPVEVGLLLDEEIKQLFQCWYASKTLPGNFTTTRRHLSATLHIARFDGKQDGWTYAEGRPNGIKLCIASVTDRANRNVDLASISLVAAGFYLSSGSLYVLDLCSCRKGPRRRCPCYGYPASINDPDVSPTISLKVYIEERAGQKELEEYRPTFHPPGGQTGDRVQKIALSKPVVLKLHQRYTISAEMTGIQKSYYGTEGKSSVTTPTSSGDFNVTVEFSSVPEARGNRASGVPTELEPSRITSAALGQFPEFYFEVIG